MNRTPEQLNLRLQVLENKAKQCSVLLRSDEVSDAEKERIRQKQRHVELRSAAIKNRLQMNGSKKPDQKHDHEMQAASRIQRAMRRFRFLKLKTRTQELDNLLAKPDLSANDRALLMAKRLLVVEKIKKLGQGRGTGRRAMLEAKFKYISTLLASPNISDHQRAKLSSRLQNISLKMAYQGQRGHGHRHHFAFHEWCHSGKGKGFGRGRGEWCPDDINTCEEAFDNCEWMESDNHDHGKGKGCHGKGKGHHDHHGKGKGHHDPHGKGKHHDHHGKGGGKGKGHHHGKGKGCHGKGRHGMDRNCEWMPPYPHWEHVDLPAQCAFEEPYEIVPDNLADLPVAFPKEGDEDLDLAFAIAMSLDESASDEE